MRQEEPGGQINILSLTRNFKRMQCGHLTYLIIIRGSVKLGHSIQNETLNLEL